MIGIVSAPAAGAGDALPVAAAPSTGSTESDQAFDEVFRQLTGGLLTTSAMAGDAAAAVEGEPVEAGAEKGSDDADLPVAALMVPMPFAPPAEPVDAKMMPAAGGEATVPADDTSIDVDGTRTASAAAASGVHGNAVNRAGANVTASAASAVNTNARGANLLSRAAASDEGFPGAVTAPADEVNADDGATQELPAEDAGDETPSTQVEANVRGLDRRRGMRETPARARTFDEHDVPAAATSRHGHDTTPAAAGRGGDPTGPAAAIARSALERPSQGAADVAPGGAHGVAVGAAPASAPDPAAESVPESLPAAAPTDTPAAAPTWALPAHVERVFALQRALARQTRDETNTAAVPGDGIPGDQPTAVPISPGGATAGGDEPATWHRQPRASNATPAAGSPVAAVAAGGAAGVLQGAVGTGAARGVAEAADTIVTRRGAGAGAAWRAALAATSFGEAPGPPAEGARVPAAPGLSVPAFPAFDLPVVRDRGPLVEIALPAPPLDTATAESVQTQIVKSIRLQWSGGLGEARVTLRPEYLGEVVASVKVEQGVVTATLRADTPEVRRWMESHTATLRDALVEHGLRLDRLTVAEPERQQAEGDRHSRPRHRQQDAPRQQPRRQPADTGTPFDLTPE